MSVGSLLLVFTGLATLSALTGLQGLDVSHSSITSRGLLCLSTLCNLRELAIAGTHVTVPSSLAKVLTQHSQLTRLDISLCRCGGLQALLCLDAHDQASVDACLPGVMESRQVIGVTSSALI